MPATMDALIAGIDNGERRGYTKGSFTPQATGAFHSLWLVAGEPGPGVAPGSLNGVVPTDATAGANPFVNGTLENFLGGFSANGLAVGTLTVYDRLWANSTTTATTGAQAITFPGLTRFTDGIGVEVWCEWYTAAGASLASNVSMTYTDQDNNSGQVQTNAIVMPAVTQVAGQMHGGAALLSGDYGVRAISSMALTVSKTTGTWGLTMMKRLASIPIRPSDQGASVLSALDLGFPDIPNDACLAFMFQGAVTANTLTGDFVIGKN
jgi:hypothetical protein